MCVCTQNSNMTTSELQKETIAKRSPLKDFTV